MSWEATERNNTSIQDGITKDYHVKKYGKLITDKLS